VALIVNPIAGRRLTALLHQQLPRLLSRHGPPPQVHLTRGPGHATQLARKLAADAGLIIAVGGDGTVSEVARGLAQTVCPLGVIPAGTANMLAKDLAIPLDPARAVRALVAGEVREMDLFRVNGRLGAMVVSAGLDAAIARRMGRSRRGHIGYLSYLRGIRRELRSYPRPPVELVVDGRRQGSFYDVIVTNTRLYGGLFRLVPGACLDDGLLEVCGFAGQERYRPYKHLAALLLGRHGRLDDVFCQRGSRIELWASGDVPYQVDGDFAGTGSLLVEVVPLALRVVVPRRPTSWWSLSRRSGPWCRRDTCESAQASSPSGPAL